MERSSRPELAFGEGLDGGPHVRVVGWAVPVEDPGKPVGFGSAQRSSVS